MRACATRFARGRPLARGKIAKTLLLCLGLYAGSVRADPTPPSAADLAAARELGMAGAILADQGRCKEAVGKLQRAAALYAAPTIVGRLGECQVKLGHLVRGTETLERVVHEELDADAPKPFVEAQERAKKVLARALPQIAKLVIVVHAPQGVTPRVTVDDQPVPPALLGAPRPTDPGDRAIQARAPGCLPADASVRLDPGARKVVHLTLTIDPNAPLPETPAAAPTPRHPSPRTADHGAADRDRTVAYVLFGVGGAGVIAGSVLGLMAAEKEGVLSANCPGNRCSPAYKNDIDTGRALGTGATIAFGVGLAAAAAGAYFFFSSPAPKEGRATQRGISARAWLGPGSVGVTGSF